MRKYVSYKSMLVARRDARARHYRRQIARKLGLTEAELLRLGAEDTERRRLAREAA
jgi:hypothetical protein